MNKFEIPLDQAVKEFYEIEGRYHAICRFARLPEGLPKRIQDAANYARHLAILTEEKAKKR